MGTERTQRVTPSTGDVELSNNTASVIGIMGLPIQNHNTPGGVLFVDSNGQAVQCLPFGGDLSGTPDNAVLNVSSSLAKSVLSFVMFFQDGRVVLTQGRNPYLFQNPH